MLSPAGYADAQSARAAAALASSGCSCSGSWFQNAPPDVILSPSPSPSGPLVGPFDSLDFSDVNPEVACRSTAATSSVTSPIAVTGPPLAHGPFGPASHLSAGAGNTAPVAYSLPPHLYLPPMNPGPVGSYSPPRMTFGSLQQSSSEAPSFACAPPPMSTTSAARSNVAATLRQRHAHRYRDDLVPTYTPQHLLSPNLTGAANYQYQDCGLMISQSLPASMQHPQHIPMACPDASHLVAF